MDCFITTSNLQEESSRKSRKAKACGAFRTTNPTTLCLVTCSCLDAPSCDLYFKGNICITTGCGRIFKWFRGLTDVLHSNPLWYCWNEMRHGKTCSSHSAKIIHVLGSRRKTASVYNTPSDRLSVWLLFACQFFSHHHHFSRHCDAQKIANECLWY